MFTAWAEGRAIRRIFGATARVAERRELRQRREVRTEAMRLTGNAAWIVLKSYRRPRDARREAEKLEAVQRIDGVTVPRCMGVSGSRFVREFVPGVTLAARERELGFDACRDLHVAAVEMLAKIHAARHTAASRARLSAPFERDALAARLRRTLGRIERVGFPQFAALRGPLPHAWSVPALTRIARQLIEDLGTETAGAVLGHGDFCAANLVFEPSGGLVAIDWDQLALATPWRDLGRLVRAFPASQRAELTARHLAAAQGSGHLREARESRASRTHGERHPLRLPRDARASRLARR